MASGFYTEQEPQDFENLAALAENVVYRVPGCSDVMVRKTIQDVYRDFCRRSCCLHGIRHFEITSDDVSVVCAPMFGGVVDCVTSVFADGRIPLDWRHYRADGGRITFTRIVLPSKGDTRGIDAGFIEIPKMNSESVPSWFIQKHGEAIVSGVLARLMSMTGRAWTDAQQASDERIRYENAVNETRIQYYAQDSNGNTGRAVDTRDLV